MSKLSNDLRDNLKNYLIQCFEHDKDYPIRDTLKVIDHYFRSLSVKERLKKMQPSAPAIALFCSIIHQSGIDGMGDETTEKYCKRICKQFDIIYRDKVRQNFRASIDIKKAKHLPEVQKSIFPFIYNKQKQRIIEFVNTKIKLYA